MLIDSIIYLCYYLIVSNEDFVFVKISVTFLLWTNCLLNYYYRSITFILPSTTWKSVSKKFGRSTPDLSILFLTVSPRLFLGRLFLVDMFKLPPFPFFYFFLNHGSHLVDGGTVNGTQQSSKPHSQKLTLSFLFMFFFFLY